MHSTLDFTGYTIRIEIGDGNSKTIIPASDILSCTATTGIGDNSEILGFNVGLSGSASIVNVDDKYKYTDIDGYKMAVVCIKDGEEFTKFTAVCFNSYTAYESISFQFCDVEAYNDSSFTSFVSFPCTLSTLASSVGISGDLINGNAVINNKPSGCTKRKVFEYIAMMEGGLIIPSGNAYRIARPKSTAPVHDLTDKIMEAPVVLQGERRLGDVYAEYYESVQNDDPICETVQSSYLAHKQSSDKKALDVTNFLIDEANVKSVVSNISNAINGIRIKNVNATIFDSPTIELLDKISFEDPFLGNIQTYVTELTWTYNGPTVIGSSVNSSQGNSGEMVEDQISGINNYLNAEEQTRLQSERNILAEVESLANVVETMKTSLNEILNTLTLSGRVSATPTAANTVTTVHVDFSTANIPRNDRTFAAKPRVVAMPESTTPLNFTGYSVTNVDKDGFDLKFAKTNTVASNFVWIAVGRTNDGLLSDLLMASDVSEERGES